MQKIVKASSLFYTKRISSGPGIDLYKNNNKFDWIRNPRYFTISNIQSQYI